MLVIKNLVRLNIEDSEINICIKYIYRYIFVE